MDLTARMFTFFWKAWWCWRLGEREARRWGEQDAWPAGLLPCLPSCSFFPLLPFLFR